MLIADKFEVFSFFSIRACFITKQIFKALSLLNKLTNQTNSVCCIYFYPYTEFCSLSV